MLKKSFSCVFGREAGEVGARCFTIPMSSSQHVLTHFGGSLHRCGWRPFASPSGLTNFHSLESTPSSRSACSANSFKSRIISAPLLLPPLLVSSFLLVLLLFFLDKDEEDILYFKLLEMRLAFNMFTQHTRRQTNTERPFGGRLDFDLCL